MLSHRPLARERARAGFGLFESMLALSVMAALAAGAAVAFNDKTASLKAKAAGEQLATVAKAAERYILDHPDVVNGLIPDNGRHRLPLDTLATNGYLPDRGYGASPYGHAHEVWLVDTDAAGGRIVPRAMTLATGAEDPGRTRLAEIAFHAGARAGIVVNPPWPNADPNAVLGLYGGWSASVSTYRGGGNGRVWAAVVVPTDRLLALGQEDYLYRGSVPGRPDLNEMRTRLHMTGDTCVTFGGDSGDDDGKTRLCGDSGDNDITMTGPTDGTRNALVLEGPNLSVVNGGGISVAGGGDVTVTGGDVAVANGDVRVTSRVGGTTRGIYLKARDPRNLTTTGGRNGNSLAINSSTGHSNNYNLYVDGSTNLNGTTRITNGPFFAGDTTVSGLFTVNTGPVTINADTTINGLLTLRDCLAVGNAPQNTDACLEVARNGRAYAARFRGDVDAQDNVTVGDTVQAQRFIYTSDARLKTNVKTIENGLERILALRGVGYDWRNNGRHDVGLLAQEVEKVFPELVNTDGKGMKAVQYANLVAPMIEAVRELALENAEMRATLQRIERAMPEPPAAGK